MKNRMRWVGLLLLLLVSFESVGQLNPYKYRLGAGIGYTNYYGDLSPYRINGTLNFNSLFRTFEFNPNYIQQESYALSLEKRLSASVGLMVQAGRYDISMSDRYLDKNNQLQRNLPNFNRALNFNTRIQDLGLALVFRTDNGKILNQKAFIAPFFSLGIGYLDFSVSGDILNDNGTTYDYTQESVVNNYRFETNLRQLNTELTEGYDTYAFYAGLGLGLRFRLGKQIELFVQSDIRGTTTDYLDDVSGEYRSNYDNEFQRYVAMPGTNMVDPAQPNRGDPNLGNDWYILHQAGLKLSFAPSRAAFKANRVSPFYDGYVYQGNEESTLPKKETSESKADSLKTTADENRGPQYFTFIQINNDRPYSRKIDRKLEIIDRELGLMGTTQQIEQYERVIGTLDQKLDSLNLQENNLRNNLEDMDEGRLGELAEQRRALIDQRDSTVQQINTLRDQGVSQKSGLDSLRNLPLEEVDQYNGWDSLSFLNGLRQLPDAIANGLNQRSTGRQFENSGQVYQERSPTQNGGPLLFAQTPGENAGQSAGTSQPLNQYYNYPSYYTPERNNYPIQERQAPYYSSQRAPENTNQNDYSRSVPPPTQRGSNFIPIFIPQSGSREITEEENSAASQTQGQNYLPDGLDSAAASSAVLPSGARGPGISVRSAMSDRSPANRLEFLKDSTLHLENPGFEGNALNYVVRNDTVLVEKEIRIGLKNSKTEVYFDINKSELTEDEKIKLDPIVNLLSEHQDYRVALSGFADNTGNVNYNLALVDKRVSHVKSLLQEYGIDEDRIIKNPGGLLVRGNSRVPRIEDRKVEITVLNDNGKPNIKE